MASSGVALEDIPSVDLMTELLHRFKCSSKPDKRLILVGNIYAFIIQTLYVCVALFFLLVLSWGFVLASILVFVTWKSFYFLGLR
jgi:hypothetical protein